MLGTNSVPHIVCTWHVHVLSISRMAERRSQERRQPIAISRRDNDTLTMDLTSGNVCVHGPWAHVEPKKNTIQPLLECYMDVKYDLTFTSDLDAPTVAVEAVPRHLLNGP